MQDLLWLVENLSQRERQLLFRSSQEGNIYRELAP